MAYQKLQVGTGIPVIPSDTIDIPAVSGPAVDSTMSQVPPTTSTIVDSTQDFTTIVGLVGSTVIVGTGIARVASVGGATQITLDAAIAGAAAVPYQIYVGATNPGCVLVRGQYGQPSGLDQQQRRPYVRWHPCWLFRPCSGQACFRYEHHGYGHHSPVVTCGLPSKTLSAPVRA